MMNTKKGFTVLELSIIVSIIAVIFVILFSSQSSIKKKSAFMVEKGMSLSMFKRISKAVQQEIKHSIEIVIPKVNEDSKFVLLKTDQEIPVLLGFDLKYGLFKTKNGKKRLLVRIKQKNFSVTYIKFVAKSKTQLEFYLKARMNQPDEALVEFFDVFNL
ncbi:hypothetical protein MJH12_16640 [bacterium]|nr:hypothetical protein [bacterium]